jgi:hypothetical protein
MKQHGEAPKLSSLEACVSDIRKWMAANVVLLKSDKTEMLVLGPKKQRDLLLNLIINLDGCTVVSNKTVLLWTLISLLMNITVEIITEHGRDVQMFIDDQQSQIIIITVDVEGATGQHLRSKCQLAFYSRSLGVSLPLLLFLES